MDRNLHPRPLAVIVDRDGTLASCHRRPLDGSDAEWGEFNAALPFDAPVPLVVALLHAVRPGVTRIMVSGRSEGDWPGDRRRRFRMQDWIVKHRLPVDVLFMRSGGDRRVDSTVKREILEHNILPYWDVRMAIDDRPQIIEVWRSHDIPVVAVTDPGLLPALGA